MPASAALTDAPTAMAVRAAHSAARAAVRAGRSKRSNGREPAGTTGAQVPRGLVYVTDEQPGIRRIRRGDAFVYRKPDGRPVRAQAELQRIRRLAIPPAYEDVWICTDPRGHVQATGRDARGRKQYRYHPEWRAARDANKFE